MNKQFDHGDKVNTPNGPGIVVYRRMAAPDYSVAAMYSVCLDSRREDYNYSGTAFSAEQVKES